MVGRRLLQDYVRQTITHNDNMEMLKRAWTKEADVFGEIVN